MFGRVLTVVLLAAAIALSLLLQSTNPSTAGPVGLLAVFFLLYVLLVCVLTWLLFWLGQAVVYLTRPVVLKKPLQPMSMSHAYYYASIIALAPVMLLAMRSVSQLGVYEIVLVILFVAIGVFYVKKRSS